MTTKHSRLRLTLTAAAFALFAVNLQGCEYEAGSAPQQPAAVRRPDFQDGPLTVYYTSETTADVVLAGITHKIGQGVAQSDLPFEYEWEDDGDINLLYQGVPYEVESPHDALDDTLDLLKSKKKHKGKAAVGMAAPKKMPLNSVAPKPAAPPLLPPRACYELSSMLLTRLCSIKIEKTTKWRPRRISGVRSKSLASLRNRAAQAKLRSTTHRFGSKVNPFFASGNLTTINSMPASLAACAGQSPV